MKINYGTICCDLEISPEFTYVCRPGIRCDYPQDTIEYAVVHFLRKNEEMKKSCAWESWQLRLAKGRNRKPRRYTYCIPAKKLELPGFWAVLDLSVSNIGVTVHSLKLSTDFPTCSKNGKGPQIRLCA